MSKHGRLIDADALIAKCGDWYCEEGTEEGFIGVIKHLIDAQPTIEPEHKTGRWIPDNNNYITPHFVCSVCGASQKVETIMYSPIWAYCPKCGADMTEEGAQDGQTG